MFGQTPDSVPTLNDVLLLIDAVQPITAARAQAMARIGVDLVNFSVPLAGDPNSDAAKQLGVIGRRLQLHAAQATAQDADDLYQDPNGLRFDLGHAFNAVEVLAPGAQRDAVFAQGANALRLVQQAPVVLKPVENPAEKAFRVLSVVGSIAVAVGTAVALFTGRSKITKLLER